MKAPFTCGVLLGLAAAAQAAITVENHPNGNFTPSSSCPAADGSNQLQPVPVEIVAPPTAGQGVMAELANTANRNFTGWTFNSGSSLNGTLRVNFHFSKFYGAHYSGGRLSLRYTPGPGDPARIRFVQLVDTTAPMNNYAGPYIDRDPADTNNTPFYFAEFKAAAQPTPTFLDGPRRNHPPNSNVKWVGTVYLASWDGNTPGTVTLHDGVKWGWLAGCATEPTPPPTITPGRIVTNLSLTWPSNSPNHWKIMSSSSVMLTTNSNWFFITNAVYLSNLSYSATVTMTESQSYFRAYYDTYAAAPQNLSAYVNVDPESVTNIQGRPVYFYGRADGDEPITYQWYHNNNPLSGMTNSDLTINHTLFAQQGNYQLVASNAFGVGASEPALLQLTPDFVPPQFLSAQPTNGLQEILLTFTEPVNPAGALNRFNYQIVWGSNTNVPAAIQPTGNEAVVRVIPPGPLIPGTSYQLRASGITDFAVPPNALPPGSFIPFNTPP